MVLVSNFTSTLDIVEAMMRKKRYSYLRLDGKTPQDERMDMVNQFNRDGVDSSFVFLLSAKSGGVGLNLIGANRLVLIDSDWNPSTDLQAMARIHRDGQKKVCYIYRLLLSGTMDEKIYQRQISKLGLTDSLIKGDKSSSDTFSQEELRDIFTLHLDSPCISHRQLVCDCDRRGGDASLDGLAEGMDASQTSVASSDDDLPGFVAASQHVVDRAQKDKLDKRKRLLALYKWAHYDCVQHPESFEEDEMVAALVRASRSSVRANGAEKSEDEWSTSMAERADDLCLGSDDSERDEDGMGEQQTDGGEGFDWTLCRRVGSSSCLPKVRTRHRTRWSPIPPRLRWTSLASLTASLHTQCKHEMGFLFTMPCVCASLWRQDLVGRRVEASSLHAAIHLQIDAGDMTAEGRAGEHDDLSGNVLGQGDLLKWGASESPCSDLVVLDGFLCHWSTHPTGVDRVDSALGRYGRFRS